MALIIEEDIAAYVQNRCEELDSLIAQQEPDSNHAYALMAGKFEILRLAVALDVKNLPTS